MGYRQSGGHAVNYSKARVLLQSCPAACYGFNMWLSPNISLSKEYIQPGLREPFTRVRGS